jgi:hypothetical protein
VFHVCSVVKGICILKITRYAACRSLQPR